MGQGHGAAGKGVHLKSPHGPVPDNGSGIGQNLGKTDYRRRADIKGHPAIRYILDGYLLVHRIRSKTICGNHVHGQVNLYPFFSCICKQFTGTVQQIVFHPGCSDPVPLALEKGVGHGTADEHTVHLVQHIIQGTQFAGHLGTADNGHQGTEGIINGTMKIFQLFLKQETCPLLFAILRDAYHRGMGTMGDSKGIVDVHISK